MITGKTRVFALLGDPVAHSLSPAMQNAAFHALGLDAVYVPLACTAGELPGLMRVLCASGGGGDVTVPHKEAAARAVDDPTALVREARACNTFFGGADGIAGDNTDVAGILAALDRLEAPATRWLVIGTGGSSRAIVCAARLRGAALAIKSRSTNRRLEIEKWMVSLGVQVAFAPECDVVINATPLGLEPDDPPPLGPDEIPAAEAALDLVYCPGETRWVHDMRRRGFRATDGRSVLIAQGAAALERWFPGERAPTELMRAVLETALR